MSDPTQLIAHRSASDRAHPSLRQKKRTEFWIRFGKQLLIDGTAAGVARTLIAPIERVKIVLQVQRMTIMPHFPLGIVPQLHTPYKNMIDGLKRIPEREGWLALYRGNGVNVLRIFPTNLIRFALFDRLNVLLAPTQGDATTLFQTKLVTGALSGSILLSLTYPLDYARTLLTADTTPKSSPHRLYRGLFDCLFKTAQREGVLAAYKGLGISNLGVMLYTGVSYATYDSLVDVFLPESRPMRSEWLYPWLKLSLGMVSVVVAQSLTYPVDTIRRRMQLNGGLGQKQLYSGTADCIKTMILQEGWKSFYRGLAANALKTSLGGALQFVLYDSIRSAYIQDEYRDRGGR
ncbi:mitochondrial carrier [Polychytrium aggregatum]|uniref:mitochondrial carrier n=1 Tax=Polychytrium aggregatum TaxID=110093 RepID=UPI0022FDEDDB|nr:mitochondrial carrier [Polychytrium aggregatum]KAI9204824.1 mitochondrial carrier [Polychytrium aggregatum]